MKDGTVATQGPPTQVFTPALLAEVFGLDADVLSDPRTGLPIVVPVDSRLIHRLGDGLIRE